VRIAKLYKASQKISIQKQKAVVQPGKRKSSSKNGNRKLFLRFKTIQDKKELEIKKLKMLYNGEKNEEEKIDILRRISKLELNDKDKNKDDKVGKINTETNETPNNIVSPKIKEQNKSGIVRKISSINFSPKRGKIRDSSVKKGEGESIELSKKDNAISKINSKRDNTKSEGDQTPTKMKSQREPVHSVDSLYINRESAQNQIINSNRTEPKITDPHVQISSQRDSDKISNNEMNAWDNNLVSSPNNNTDNNGNEVEKVDLIPREAEAKDEEIKEEELDIPDESKVGKKLTDLTTKRTIVLVLSLLMAIILFNPDFYLQTMTAMDLGLRIFGEFKDLNDPDYMRVFNLYVNQFKDINSTNTPVIYVNTFNITYGDFNQVY